MKWSEDAETAIKKVPFFVRKKVRKRVEKEALAEGKKEVTLTSVMSTQKRFLSKMDKEVKGYQLDSCFGPGGCPNSTVLSASLLKKTEKILIEADLLAFLKKNVTGPLKFHHEFRVTIAECPNACSQPQIKDIGIIGASMPGYIGDGCTGCRLCVSACREHAIIINEKITAPVFNMDACLFCGACMKICPESVILASKKGYRVQLGGKLGRHPALAKELPDVYTEDEVVDIVKKCLAFYKKHSTDGRRFADLVQEDDHTIQKIIS